MDNNKNKQKVGITDHIVIKKKRRDGTEEVVYDSRTDAKNNNK